MELEHFIEQDIMQFLESRRSAEATPMTATPRRNGVLAPEEVPIYSLGRDYLTEMEKWLRDHDFDKAKRTLLDLKEELQHYPADAPELVEGKRLFESMYATFQRALADERSRESQLEARAQRPAPPPVQAAAQPRGLTEQEEHALLADIDHLKELIFENSFAASVSAYQQIRSNLHPEYMTSEQRMRILPQLRSLYLLLHERLLTRNSPAPVEPEKPAEAEPPGVQQTGAEQLPVFDSAEPANAPPAAPEQSPAEQFKSAMAATEQAINAKQRQEAVACYMQMHSLFDSMPPEQQETARAAIADLYSRLLALDEGEPQDPKTTLENEERRLTGAP